MGMNRVTGKINTIKTKVWQVLAGSDCLQKAMHLCPHTPHSCLMPVVQKQSLQCQEGVSGQQHQNETEMRREYVFICGPGSFHQSLLTSPTSTPPLWFGKYYTRLFSLWQLLRHKPISPGDRSRCLWPGRGKNRRFFILSFSFSLT